MSAKFPRGWGGANPFSTIHLFSFKLKFRAQLSWAWKKVYNLGTWANEDALKRDVWCHTHVYKVKNLKLLHIHEALTLILVWLTKWIYHNRFLCNKTLFMLNWAWNFICSWKLKWWKFTRYLNVVFILLINVKMPFYTGFTVWFHQSNLGYW